MADNMTFELVSPAKKLASTEAEAVTIPGMEGDLTAMANHAPFLTTLRPGFVVVRNGSAEDKYFVTGGFAEISDNTVSVLAEGAVEEADVTQDYLDAQIAEAEVDMALGTTRVCRITAAHDLGRVINPTLAEGQIEGGIAQGLGFALMEEFIPGRTENLHDYLIPTVGDMPEIASILIEKPDPEGPMGARGLGEHVLIPTAPAILNAIRHASGARIRQVPALPHRVLAAIRAAAR